jgi:hypothetical protein
MVPDMGCRNVVKKDFGTLLWAERLVLSKSTLVRAAMYLSPVAKTWYNFGGLDVIDWGCGPVWHSIQPLGPHWHSIPSRRYQKHIAQLGTWHVQIPTDIRDN